MWRHSVTKKSTSKMTSKKANHTTKRHLYQETRNLCTGPNTNKPSRVILTESFVPNPYIYNMKELYTI